MIKHCNAITTKNEFSLYRKSRENKDEKKNGSEKLIKSPNNRLRGALSNLEKETQNTFHPTSSCDFANGPRELIAVISSTLQKLQQNRPARVLTFRSNYDYTVPVNCFKI